MHIRYEFTDKIKPFASNSFVTFLFSEFNNEPSLMHSHKFTEIIFVLKGKGQLVTETKTYDFSQSCVYFVNPNTSHTEVSPDNSLKYYMVKLKNFRLNKSDDVVCLELSDTTRRNVMNLLSDACSEVTLRADNFNEIIYFNLLNILYKLKRELVKKGESIESETDIPDGLSIVKRVREFLVSHYNIEFRIEDLSKEFAMSHNSLTKLFKKETGTTPIKFLTARRIEAAKTLLGTSDFSISQIVSMTGFNNHAFFSKQFKNIVGCTPTEYRERHKSLK